jgi:hypothetical protein
MPIFVANDWKDYRPLLYVTPVVNVTGLKFIEETAEGKEERTVG